MRIGPKTYTLLLVDEVDIYKHKILYEDVKAANRVQEIEFTGTPFIILGAKRLNCVHGVDHHISDKAKRIQQKIAEKVRFFGFSVLFGSVIWNDTSLFLQMRSLFSWILKYLAFKCHCYYVYSFKNKTQGEKVFQKTRLLSQGTKKMNCEAKVIIRDVMFFPDFKVMLSLSISLTQK